MPACSVNAPCPKPKLIELEPFVELTWNDPDQDWIQGNFSSVRVVNGWNGLLATVWTQNQSTVSRMPTTAIVAKIWMIKPENYSFFVPLPGRPLAHSPPHLGRFALLNTGNSTSTSQRHISQGTNKPEGEPAKERKSQTPKLTSCPPIILQVQVSK